jgi:hypothetical protein
MDRYGGPQRALTIVLHRSLYLAIITDRYGGPNSAIVLDLYTGL